MATYRELADAIVQFEGAYDPRSVNMRMVTQHGLWNVGHLAWAGQRGAVPVNIGGRIWAGWPTMEESYDGLIRQIKLDVSRGLTLRQFVSKYAPASENPTESYIAHLSSHTGIPPDGKLADYIDQSSYFQYAGRKAGEETPLLPDAGGESADPGVEVAALGGAAGAFVLLAIAGTAALLVRR